MGVLNADYHRFGPLVRRRIRQFFAVEERPDDVLEEFFASVGEPGEASCDWFWAQSTRHCLRRVRAGGRRTLLATPLQLGSWAELAGAGANPGFRALARSWREETPEMLELLLYAEVDGMSAGQIAELLGKPRSWVVDLLHARAGGKEA